MKPNYYSNLCLPGGPGRLVAPKNCQHLEFSPLSSFLNHSFLSVWASILLVRKHPQQFQSCGLELPSLRQQGVSTLFQPGLGRDAENHSVKGPVTALTLSQTFRTSPTLLAAYCRSHQVRPKRPRRSRGRVHFWLPLVSGRSGDSAQCGDGARPSAGLGRTAMRHESGTAGRAGTANLSTSFTIGQDHRSGCEVAAINGGETCSSGSG